jgi:hypothetical protein
MAKGYRPVLRDQPFLMPVDMREWLPADHLIWFVLDVVEQLDTSAFHRRRKVRAVSGRAAFDPDLLLGLLLYAIAAGCARRGRSSGCARWTWPSGSPAPETCPITR